MQPHKLFSIRGQDRLVPSRSAILCTSKRKALAGDATKGFQQTPPTHNTSRGTTNAIEQRIAEIRVAMDAAAAAGDLATYKQHQAEYTRALSARSPEQIHRLDEQHLAAVERAAALGDHGLRYVPAAWLESDTGRAVAWRTSRPVAGEAESRRSA